MLRVVSAVRTGLEPATSAVTGRRSSQTELPNRFQSRINGPLYRKIQDVRRCIVEFQRMWSGAELNRRHQDFQSCALPTELPDPSRAQNILSYRSRSQQRFRVTDGFTASLHADSALSNTPHQLAPQCVEVFLIVELDKSYRMRRPFYDETGSISF